MSEIRHLENDFLQWHPHDLWNLEQLHLGLESVFGVESISEAISDTTRSSLTLTGRSLKVHTVIQSCLLKNRTWEIHSSVNAEMPLAASN